MVPEDETAMVGKNPIANPTVDADENVYAADNLPSVDNIPPSHFIYQDDLDNMKMIGLKEILKVRVLIISGKKADLKIQLQQAVAEGVTILLEEEKQHCVI